MSHELRKRVSKFREFLLTVHFDGTLPRLFFNKFTQPNAFKEPTEQLHVIEYSALEQANEKIEGLEKEKTYLTLQLVDRSEKYKQFMDSGLDAQMFKNEQLEKQNEELKAEIIVLNRHLADERSGDCDKDKTIRRLTQNVNQLNLDNEELKQKLEVAKKALEFYADIMSWECCEGLEPKSDIIQYDISMASDPDFGVRLYGGKTARQALKEIRK